MVVSSAGAFVEPFGAVGAAEGEVTERGLPDSWLVAVELQWGQFMSSRVLGEEIRSCQAYPINGFHASLRQLLTLPDKAMVAAAIRTIFAQPTGETARGQTAEVVKV